MTFTEPQHFEEALAKLDEREVILSPLRSAQWRDKVAAGLRDRAFFSSTLENARVAQSMKDFIGDFLSKAIDPDTGGLRAGSRAEFVAEMRELCIREGLGKLDPDTGRIDPEIDERDLTDLRSMARLQLIFDTQTTAAHEYGFWAQGNDPDLLYAFPAQRFLRIRPVRTPRPIHAANNGAVRRKDDLDFWLSMNPDFGVPYGPWGFNSGMGVEDVDRIEAEELGIISPGEEIAPPDRELNDRLSAGVRDLDPDIRAELRSIFGPQIREAGDRMEWTGSRSTATVPSPLPGTAAAPATPDQIRTAVAAAADRSEAHRLLEIPLSEQGALALVAPARGALVSHVSKGRAFIERTVHKDWIPAAQVKIKRGSSRSRGYYSPTTKTATVRADTSNVVHEVAHHLEMENPALYRACKDFRKSRTQGEVAQPLRVLTGQTGYKSHEIAYEDEWANKGGSHYTGKTYENNNLKTTEILTMGIERLYVDPVGFAKDDPDYFQFLISTLHKL